jgi:hypothetical protein
MTKIWSPHNRLLKKIRSFCPILTHHPQSITLTKQKNRPRINESGFCLEVKRCLYCEGITNKEGSCQCDDGIKLREYGKDKGFGSYIISGTYGCNTTCTNLSLTDG